MENLSQQQKASLVELLRRTEPRLYYALAIHRNTSNQMLTFAGRAYLLAIYGDNSQEIVIMKSVQCGISEWLIIETLSKAEQGYSTFYVLPKFDLRNTFVANRIDKLFNMVPAYKKMLREATGDADSKQIKHFAHGTIKFASSNTISDFSEFPADIVIIDEMDRCDQGNLAYAKDRTKASKFKLSRKVANPTITGIGISDEFKRSDQKEWTVCCEHCKVYQELDFFKNVVEEITEGEYQLRDREWTKESGRDIHTMCSSCGKPFDRLSEQAYWNRKNPDSSISGYHITRMMDPATTILELYKIFDEATGNETKMQAFYNSDLGIPFTSKGAKVTEFLLDKCVEDYAMPSSGQGCIMGVDVGAVLHVNVSEIKDGRRRKVYIGTVPTFEEIDNIIRAYGVECAVVDALPETHKAKELRDRNRGIVWLCEFHPKEGSVKEITLKLDEYKVNCDRTQVIDEAHSDIVKRQVIMPQNARNIDKGEFYSQMCAPTRVFDEQSSRFVWREGSKKDHYRLADVYESIAGTITKKMGVKAWTL